MKNEKRIKKQLTRKQSEKISLVVSIICGIISFFVYRNIEPDIDPNSALGIIYRVILAFMIGTVCLIFCYIVVLRGFKKEREEEREKIKKLLCKEEFTEILFTPKNNDDESQMTLGILEKTGCRFFAKLDENENIILIVHDKDDKEVWRDIIENYFYFNTKFKKKE